MLPFLKDRHEGSMSGPVEVMDRKSDDEEDFSMLDAIVEDMLEAFSSRNKKLLKGALEALIEHLQEEDEEQDKQEFEE
jgi:hypothetical protein